MQKNAQSFSITNETEESVDVIIYQNDGLGVFKTYSKTTKTLGEGFKIENMAGKTIRYDDDMLNN